MEKTAPRDAEDRNAAQHNNNNNIEQQQQRQCQRQSSSELAKIQSTVALTVDHDLLIQKSESQPRTELVLKFIDFSSKYGLGYKLSNNFYGVLFKDSTKIILHPNLFHFDYVERSRKQTAVNGNGQAMESLTDTISHFNFFEYPDSIKNKVVLLQHFKSYLDGNQKFKPLEFNFTKEQMPSCTPQEGSENADHLVYIKNWKRAKAILLRNTNKVIQVMFHDQSELILCSGSGIVYLLISLLSFQKFSENSSLEKTLRISLDFLNRVFKKFTENSSLIKNDRLKFYHDCI